MPIYEFKCKKCGSVFETLFFSMQGKQAVACPCCGSKRTEKLMSMFGGKFGNASSGSGCSTCSTTSCPPS
ncbi:MAG: FmdB family transcriptional regulator [Syntrophobacteraceae bacterium CG23_combo_of_CG06-09_8_20_14_all_50_8]|nr:MAG: FmdB family transcriptional regulator [Syntrophobacteraceae bacterium CG23_combo_of_CG06-09_8_20_14_all_50_8]